MRSSKNPKIEVWILNVLFVVYVHLVGVFCLIFVRPAKYTYWLTILKWVLAEVGTKDAQQVIIAL